MTNIISIFERIGLGGGGKVNAVYRRMNAFAEMGGFTPTLLINDHGTKPRLVFSELVAAGRISSNVNMMSVPDACLRAAIDQGGKPYCDWPEHDQLEAFGRKTVYFRNNREVMLDRSITTEIGNITRRSFSRGGSALEALLLDNVLLRLSAENSDGTRDITDCADGIPIRWTKMRGRAFVMGRNLVTGQTCRTERVHSRSYFDLIDWDDSVVFFDGVTSAYLAETVRAPRALFLHADHRSPDGLVVPRSKFLIENFPGDAIITATNAHKVEIEKDLCPSADVHVIPHVCEADPVENTIRRDVVTVSRLELTGKPIHECIKAFSRIMDQFPDTNYLIYGEGSGHERLDKLIDQLGCGDRVKLMGYTTSPLDAFKSAQLAIYPTMTEGFGLSILEALSCGCPVISYDVNYGPRELIRSGENGYLTQPGDIKGIARSIKLALQNQASLQNAARAGLERYSAAAYAENYREIATRLSLMVKSDPDDA